MSSVKPTQVCSAPAGAAKLFDNTGGASNKNYDLNSAFERRTDYQKCIGSQFHYVAPVTLYAIFVLACKKYVFFNNKSGVRKNSKTSLDPYSGQDLTIHVNKSHIHLVIQSL